jgi:hypothetical protein
MEHQKIIDTFETYQCPSPPPPPTPPPMFAASPPWGWNSSSSFTAPVHHAHCNLLSNTMFDAIYYFAVIYCVAMSYVDWLFVHCHGDIVCFDGCIHVGYLLWWSYVLMYECPRKLGDLYKIVTVGLTWWRNMSSELSQFSYKGFYYWGP